MVKCEVCGAELQNPNHPSHLKSKKHQEALQEKDMNEVQEKKEENIFTYEEKDPANTNILVVHSDRCGVSWFLRFISLMYEQMYGKVQQWNTLTSRLLAAHPDYATPKGWNTVLYVPLKDVIKKDHEKIILLQRSLESLREANFVYRYPDRNYELEKNKSEHKPFFDKLEYYYSITYDPQVKAPNLLRVRLEDLNNYTVATFTEVFDFLGFPKERRPILIPVNPPERTWQSYSSVLSRGQPINRKLREIYYHYNHKQLEFIDQGGDSKIRTATEIIKPRSKQENELLPIEKKIQRNWNWKMNPNTLDLDDALEVLKNEREEIHIVLIGATPNLKGCHFSEHVSREFERMNVKVTSLNMPQIFLDLNITEENVYHVNWIEIQEVRGYTPFKHPKELSIREILNFYKLEPDFIFIDGTRFKFNNDTKYIFFYNHKAWYKNPPVKNVDLVFMKNDSYIDIYKENLMCDMVHLPPSVDLTTYYPEEKTITKLSGIGYRRDWNNWARIVKPIKGYMNVLYLIKAETELFKACGYDYINTPISDEKYRELLRQMKVFWFPVPYGQGITRRMIEAMACKALCIFRLDNKEHEDYLSDLGFKRDEHYVGIDKPEDILRLNEILDEKDINLIRKNAYEEVIDHHTHRNRAEYIIDTYKNFINERYDVIVPLFNIQEDIFSYIDNWFEHLPIRKLFLGCGKDLLKIPENYKYKEKIMVFNQTKNKTLGMCIADLMKKVQTKWFAFIHSDVKLKDNTLEEMKKHMHQPIGCLEAGQQVLHRHMDGILTSKLVDRMSSPRGYSGFQMFRTDAIKYIITKIEDDFVYRNEDIIFQNAVTGSGYEYLKLPIQFDHYNEGGYVKNKEDIQGMFYGLFKYSYPTKITKYVAILNLKFHDENYGHINIHDLRKFMNENYSYNNEWKRATKVYLDSLKKKYQHLYKTGKG